MSKLFIESVFTRETALYDTETNTVILDNQVYTYEAFDKEHLVLHIHTIDEYNFEFELSDQAYVNHIYETLYIDYYSPAPEIYF